MKYKIIICALMITIVIANVLFSLPILLSMIRWPIKYSLISFDQHESISSYFKNVTTELLNWSYVTANNNGRDRGRKLRITVEDFWNGHMTGNSLIDDYGKNNITNTGEMGIGVTLTGDDKKQAETIMSSYRINTIVSDKIPLNRLVPDSRIKGCELLQYNTSLPSASVILPFYNEWPSVLLRSVYSIINRSPRRLLKEIILVDDASTLDSLKQPLDDYIEKHFPENLVRVQRMPKRSGLIRARMRGCREATGDVLIIFDSHMEVNIEWLSPLLNEINKDRTTVALATLDYINAVTFEYRYHMHDLIRYGWEWRLQFYGVGFRPDQIGPEKISPRRGVVMVGTAFAIDRKYFFELGAYDEGMEIWGGENLELSWRVWLCGGRLIHVPCSRTGHIARYQPYIFPGGRDNIVHFNYKRAIDVWMGNYSRFVYHMYPDLKTLDAGDISERLALKEKLVCKDFSWYLRNVWPELNVPDENVTHWGEVINEGDGRCLDNNNFLFGGVWRLYLSNCSNTISNQAFSLTTDSLLRVSLQCVVVKNAADGTKAEIQDCITGTRDKWIYSQDHSLVHLSSNLCLDIGTSGPIMKKCEPSKITQKWLFKQYTFTNNSS